MQMRAIVLAFSWAASSLTLTVTIAKPATPQAREQSGEDAKQSSSDAEIKEKATKKNADPTHSTPARMWKILSTIMMPSAAITSPPSPVVGRNDRQQGAPNPVP